MDSLLIPEATTKQLTASELAWTPRTQWNPGPDTGISTNKCFFECEHLSDYKVPTLDFQISAKDYTRDFLSEDNTELTLLKHAWMLLILISYSIRLTMLETEGLIFTHFLGV